MSNEAVSLGTDYCNFHQILVCVVGECSPWNSKTPVFQGDNRVSIIYVYFQEENA